jgi:hypothetical protein
MQKPIILLNHRTGECVESSHIPSLVHEVKRWVFDGMLLGGFSMQGGTVDTRMWLHHIAKQQQITSCDLCNKLTQVKHMEYVNDHEGVCMLGYCKDCSEEMKLEDDDLDLDDDDTEFNAIMDELETFEEFEMDELDDDLEPLTDLEWQKRY